MARTKKMVMVFGSNEAGVHGAGAAKFAKENHGAKLGMSYGHIGNSFAIPTKDEFINTLDINMINAYVCGFLAYAKGHRKVLFQVTRIGCGLAGFKDKDIAPLFEGASKNCYFDLEWEPYLGDGYNYWGTM